MDISVSDQFLINAQPGLPNYRIAQCPQLGRYIVATKDIKKGEIVLKDLPLALGPQKASPVLCPGCFETPSINCKYCSWPICTMECAGIKSHEPECNLLRKRKNDFKSSRDWTKLSNCLMIVRCLLLKQSDPRKWNRLIEMEPNWERWTRSPLYSEACDHEDVIRSEYGLLQAQFPSSEVMKIQAILDINAYEVRMSGSNVQAAYSLASLAEHNCIPNTHKTICSDSLELTFRAAIDIPCGSHISTSYCDILWPTWHRQQYLQWSKFFICTCERCQSSTELESHLGSLVCMDCFQDNKPAVAMPDLSDKRNWEDTGKNYYCTSCNSIFPAAECQLIHKKAEKELSELDKDADYENIYAFELWLDRWTLVERILSAEKCERKQDDITESGIQEQMEIPKQQRAKRFARVLLHPQHSLVLDVCHTVFLLYPKEDCTLSQLKRKESYGVHLLKATKQLFTGVSKFRGTIAYELGITRAAILVHQLEQSGMTDNLQHLAKEVLQLLGESQELLKYEPLDQPEGQLAQTGASQLAQLTSFFSELFP